MDDGVMNWPQDFPEKHDQQEDWLEQLKQPPK